MTRHRAATARHASHMTHKKSHRSKTMHANENSIGHAVENLPARGKEPTLGMFLTWPLQTLEFVMSPFTAWMQNLRMPEADFLFKTESSETEKAYFYKTPLPGITRDQLAIAFSNGMMILHVEASEDQKAAGFRYRSSRSMRRSLPLPVNSNGPAIRAELKNGILTIIIPKAAHPVPPPNTTLEIM